MTGKIFTTTEKTAWITCPACGKQWEMDVSKYYGISLEKEIRLKAKCQCGHQWGLVLEKRRYPRKKVTLMGSYVFKPRGRALYKGQLEIIDLSLKGLKMILDRDWGINPGDWLDVEFRLDNETRSLINRRVIVKSLSGKKISGAFQDEGALSPALGYYVKQ
ncbi:MAG: PilZ domain-containing protein [Proteobacteria bacterium]|nr:PilZ domain-containing protein [Pseudomonadota bacterium]MBU4469511.1 PilZ domain-containing protein [Pseudomonadota bacterium]MCG2753393.1 PilZ domain-containing protein [Desulfobacteraceae bacterium]